jgi:hypothetical protein
MHRNAHQNDASLRYYVLNVCFVAERWADLCVSKVLVKNLTMFTFGCEIFNHTSLVTSPFLSCIDRKSLDPISNLDEDKRGLQSG